MEPRLSFSTGFWPRQESADGIQCSISTFTTCSRGLFGVPVFAKRKKTKLGGDAEHPRARAAIHGSDALQTEQAVSYGRSRSFLAQVNHQPVPQNSLRGRQSSKPSSWGKPSE
eukprot:215796-Prymnesium_polylepis.1